ncbi:hypothetical protein J437_LFUL016804 [Ladona fulva]|uniref:DNA-directed DNA polymerase n=1 Tax=Ladona fulva TaxID=123851 RepID=A0A8K0NZB0_LADFU|nr:hypothetical protein J437_LFUL016804 [Ladona fulva]
MQPRSSFKEIICIAHNFKGYDGQFLHRHIVSKLKAIPQVLMTGTKIISLKIEGYFPHFFNTLKNENYSGALPEKPFLGYETMTELEERLACYTK